jgi:hypothetical protein
MCAGLLVVPLHLSDMARIGYSHKRTGLLEYGHLQVETVLGEIEHKVLLG